SISCEARTSIPFEITRGRRSRGEIDPSQYHSKWAGGTERKYAHAFGTFCRCLREQARAAPHRKPSGIWPREPTPFRPGCNGWESGGKSEAIEQSSQEERAHSPWALQ